MKESYLSEKTENSTSGVFRPQLTSLIDVMTILLVFLIKNFSVEGNLITPSKDISLPISLSREKVENKLSVEVSKNGVVFNGVMIAKVSDISKVDSLMIPQLFNSLKSYSSDRKELIIQADRDLEFTVVKKIMYTCSKAGFKNLSFLVVVDE